ncbi:MAG: IS5 family transposase [Nitrosopumilus sp.]|nr:IS5 family transposase [Nitrosopumilus sp.]
MKTKKTKGFFDEEFRRELIDKKDPLRILDEKINWEQFRQTLESAFELIDYSQGGRPPFDKVMMFKILILQEYYGLSDSQIEFQLLDRLSFQKFINQDLQDRVPDEKTIWLFRDTLGKSGIIDELFVQLNKRLESTGLIVNKGKIIDASFAEVPIQRNTPKENDRIKKGETPNWSENKKRQKDVDATWTKKNSHSFFGYKKHIKADLKSKLICDFDVTTASVHDSQVFEELLNKKDKGQPIYADSAYNKEMNEELKKKGFNLKVLEKGYRNKPLTKSQKEKNKKLSSKRCRVEHVFAWMRQRVGYLVRAIGLARVTVKTTLQVISYNLARSSFLIKNNRRGVSII